MGGGGVITFEFWGLLHKKQERAGLEGFDLVVILSNLREDLNILLSTKQKSVQIQLVSGSYIIVYI